MAPSTDASIRELCSRSLDSLQPRQAFRVCEKLGGLARWWLRPEVLELARQYDPSYPSIASPERPALPRSLGTCPVLFRAAQGLPLVRSAFLLPLCWRPRPDHSRFLPSGLIELARRVDREVRTDRERKQPWSLHPADSLDLRDSPLNNGVALGFDSAWAALAGCLIAASDGLLPSEKVWASGAWDTYGLAEIDGLEEKFALAVEWDASEFFVPAWQMPTPSVPEGPM